MAAGYSATPLSKKLGLKTGFKILLLHQPVNYLALLEKLPDDIVIMKNPEPGFDMIHLFVVETKKLFKELPALKKLIVSNGMIWVSWPKKASKVQTDITEDLIRELAIRTGLVDVKVCAIDAVWSGLKLVIPLKDRQ
jgi:hypothetical protein